jgi:tRNA threonylcarbamoyladenosine biosynthesis protein TsaB
MMLLALDTSTRLAGIALYSGKDGLISEDSWHSANRHTVELMPRVALMLDQAGATSANLKAVAVALGPGSFTGLRVALAAAKGLVLANDLALLGVPTLDAIAYPHNLQALPVIAVVQAGRGRVCWACYERSPAGSAASTPAALASIPALAATIHRPTLIAGELATSDREQLAGLSGGWAVLLPPALSMRRPGCLAEIAWTRYAAGERDDPASLSPIYLHDPAL